VKKQGLLRKTLVLLKSERHNEAFDTIAKAVAQIRIEKRKEKKEDVLFKQRLRLELKIP